MRAVRPPVDVSVVTSGHDVADARLHREVAALLDHGMSVEVLGLGEVADGPPGAQVRAWPRPSALRRASLAARLAAAARGRVVITLDPDSALAANAAVLSSGRVLVVDVHEDYRSLLADRPWARAGGGLAGLGARGLVEAFQLVARRAALTVVADEHVPPLRARNRLVVPNLPVPAMLPGVTPADPAPRALYVGDVRASRGLFAMIEAVRLAGDWHLDVVGPVAPGDADRLETLLREDSALAARVRLHGRRPPTQAWEAARGAWCGLLLLADTPAFRDAIPSKLAEYTTCGLPVITTDLPRQGAQVRAQGSGAVVPTGDDEHVGAAVAEVLRTWASTPRAYAQVRSAAEVAAYSGAAGTAEIDSARGPYADFADAVADLL